MTVYVARQPIFDRASEIAGYELLYRDSAVAQCAGTKSSDRMCTEMVAGTLLTIGLDRLTAGRPAYVNATREFMLEGLFRLFPPRAVVIELLETVEPDAATIAACGTMVSEGYQLALDDFVYDPRFEPLLEMAHVVKLDVLDQPPDAVAAAADQVRRFGVRLVAERVETEAVHASCAALGFDLFQGYFFSRPETLSGRVLPPGLASAIRLLNLARDPGTTDGALEEAAAADVTMSSELLRHASTATASARSASSLGVAIRAVGREALARLAALLAVSAASAAGGEGEELVRASLVRARFCERVAEVAGRPRDAGPLFMVGLFSQIDALVRVPMAEVVERIAFEPPVRAALIDGDGPYAPVLAAVAAYERGAWLDAERLAATVGVGPACMVELYAESLAWMRERVESLP